MSQMIAQISDLHISTRQRRAEGSVDTAPYLMAAVEHLNQLRPELILITGDLTARGKEEEYDKLAQLLAPLSSPIRVIPGNHDHRGRMRAKFGEHLPSEGEFLHYAFEHIGLRFIALDTTIPEQKGGTLCEQRLDFLKRELLVDKPTVLMMHHPPVATGIAHMDRMACDNADLLGQVIASHSNIELIVCGHVHRTALRCWHGTVVFICPAIANQLSLSLGPEDVPVWINEPAAVAVHLWQPGSGMITHLSYVGDFEKSTGRG